MATKRIRDLSTGTASSSLFVPAEATSGGTLKIPLGIMSIPIVEQGRYIANAAGGAGSVMTVAVAGPTTNAIVWTRIITALVPDYSSLRAVLVVGRSVASGSPGGQAVAHIVIDQTAYPNVLVGLSRTMPTTVTGLIVTGDNSTKQYDIWVQTNYGEASVAGYIFHNLPVSYIQFPMNTTTNTPTGPVMVNWATAPQSNILALDSIVASSLNPSSGYIRWDTGRQEAWAVVDVASFGAQSGAGTYADPYRRSYVWSYPAAFVETPNISVGEISSANGVVVVNVSSATSTAATLVAKYPTAGTSFSAHVVARGRWRT